MSPQYGCQQSAHSEKVFSMHSLALLLEVSRCGVNVTFTWKFIMRVGFIPTIIKQMYKN